MPSVLCSVLMTFAESSGGLIDLQIFGMSKDTLSQRGCIKWLVLFSQAFGILAEILAKRLPLDLQLLLDLHQPYSIINHYWASMVDRIVQRRFYLFLLRSGLGMVSRD